VLGSNLNKLMSEKERNVSGNSGRIIRVDNAGRHEAKSLQWHHIEPVYLPPYSPDFNPIGRPWQHLKSHFLEGCVSQYGDEPNEKLFTPIRELLEEPEIIRPVCRTRSE
jgi:transposase